ncbi:MAG: AAA family ATPase, partial [Chloroflexota bacterium]
MDKRAKIYAVVNRKGGVGKTTTAVTLGHGLAKKLEGQGHVLIVDLDPQGNVATSLGLKAEGQDIAGVLTGEVSVEEAVLHADR